MGLKLPFWHQNNGFKKDVVQIYGAWSQNKPHWPINCDGWPNL